MIMNPHELVQSRRIVLAWDVIGFESTALGVGANAPTWNTTYVGWEFNDNPPAIQEVQAYGHAPHPWREQSDFHLGIHWYLTNDGAAAEDVKWDVLYRGINHGGVWPAGWTTLEETVDVSGYVVREDIHTEWTTVSGAGLLFGCQMDFRIQRDTVDAADDHPHEVILKRFEIHYQTDAFGSYTHESKWGSA